MKRRSFITSCALGAVAAQLPVPLAAAAPAAAEADLPLIKHLPKEPLIIRKIELLKAGGEYFLRTTTRDGRVGLALCDSGLETYAPILKKMIATYFIGKDARDIETLLDGVFVHASNYKKAGIIFWSCVAWVEFSLLDLLGQAAGKPIGGLFSDELKKELEVYNSSTARDTTPEREVANFEKSQAVRGCKALKWKIGGRMSNNADAAPGRSEKLIELMTKTFPDLVHYADANGSYDAKHGIEWGKRLEAHGVKWFEEPCPFQDFTATKAVADALDRIAVTGGEQDTSLPMFKWMIENRAVDVVQPDIVYNGGIIRAKRVARMAERAGIPCTLHSPETGVGSIYMIHFAASTPNAGQYQEYHINKEGDQSWSSFQVFVMDGKIPVPAVPGKGFDVDPKLLAKAVAL